MYKYKCTECGQEYDELPQYCDCGNDAFDVVEQAAPAQQSFDTPYHDTLPERTFKRIDIPSLAIFVLCIIFAFTNLLYLLCAKLLPSYLHYFGGQYAGSGWLAITYKLLSNFVFFVIVFMSYRISKNKLDDHALIKKEKNDNFMLWVSFASFAGFILGYKINLVDRIMFYLTVYFAIFVPNALKKYNQRTADILRAAMIAVLIIYSVVVHLYRPEWGSAYPYQFFWQE